MRDTQRLKRQRPPRAPIPRVGICEAHGGHGEAVVHGRESAPTPGMPPQHLPAPRITLPPASP